MRTAFHIAEFTGPLLGFAVLWINESLADRFLNCFTPSLWQDRMTPAPDPPGERIIQLPGPRAPADHAQTAQRVAGR